MDAYKSGAAMQEQPVGEYDDDDDDEEEDDE